MTLQQPRDQVDLETCPTLPRRLSQRRQLTIPEDVLGEIGLLPGDRVWFWVHPEAMPNTITLIPQHVFANVIAKGWERLEAEQRAARACIQLTFDFDQAS